MDLEFQSPPAWAWVVVVAVVVVVVCCLCGVFLNPLTLLGGGDD